MKAFVLTSCLCVLMAGKTIQTPALPPIDLEAQDYAIYSVVLNECFAKEKVQHIVIGDQTMMEFPPIMMGMTQFGGSMKKIHETASKETFEDYSEKNKAPVLLRERFSTGAPVVLISASERDRIFQIKDEGKKKTANPDGMKELQKLYPGSYGFTNLSRIGFSKDSTQALVYVGNICGGLCGSGRLFFLVKESGNWKIKLSATTWVS